MLLKPVDLVGHVEMLLAQDRAYKDRYEFLLRANRVSDFSDNSPHDILGPHRENGALVIRANLPHANRAWITPDTSHEDRRIISMQRVPHTSVFEARLALSAIPNLGHYKIGCSTDSELMRRSVWEITHELVQQHGFTATINDLSILLAERGLDLIDEKQIRLLDDPYLVSPDVTEQDIWLWNEGTNYRAYERFGARIRNLDGIEGVHFTIWAPNAYTASVVGPFNDWEPGAHPLSRINDSELWGLFIPGLGEGTLYKFALKDKYGNLIDLKADPFALQSQFPTKNEPERTASIVTNIDGYEWRDSEWMQKRPQSNPTEKPMSILEVHPGSWRRVNQRYDNEGFLNYRDLAHEVVAHAKEMGYTHVELLPVTEHHFYGSWGYQPTGYFAPTSRYGSPQDLMYFVDYCHQNNLGVFCDWVPGSFSSNLDALNMFDGTQIFAYEDPRKGKHEKWGTLVPDYGKGAVRSFLISSAMLLLDKYHFDGLRVDAVASMLYLDYDRHGKPWMPNIHGGNEHLEAVEFLRQFNTAVHNNHPGIITIAEDSTSWQGITSPQSHGWKALGFDLKWNMGWMNGNVSEKDGIFREDPINRKFHIRRRIIDSTSYAFTENFILPFSHDEVVHGKRSLIGKMPGDDWQKFANLRLLYGYMFTYPGKKLLFMGNDIAQRREWSHDRGLDWHLLEQDERHRQINTLVKDLNRLYLTRPELHELDHSQDGFQWIEIDDNPSIVGFIRSSKDPKRFFVVVCNLTPVPRENYELSVPKGTYREILNTDDPKYGGAGNHKNLADLTTVLLSATKWNSDYSTQYRDSAIRITIPPLGVSIFEFLTSV